MELFGPGGTVVFRNPSFPLGDVPMRKQESPSSFSDRGREFDIVYLCCGGRTGVYQARQLREKNPDCKIILVDDTQEFAIQGMRLHCTDFILRPVEFRHVVRSMNLALRGRM